MKENEDDKENNRKSIELSAEILKLCHQQNIEIIYNALMKSIVYLFEKIPNEFTSWDKFLEQAHEMHEKFSKKKIGKNMYEPKPLREEHQHKTDELLILIVELSKKFDPKVVYCAIHNFMSHFILSQQKPKIAWQEHVKFTLEAYEKFLMTYKEEENG